MCPECLGAEPFVPSARFRYIQNISMLKKAGAQFNVNDLMLEDWRELLEYDNLLMEYVSTAR